MEKAYLILDNGTVFEGERIGAPFAACGELVFDTACVGYTQALTDAANDGKLLLWCFPMAGNYGVAEEEMAQKPKAFGFIARECCEKPSNFRCKHSLHEYLLGNGIPGIVGVDTRAVMAALREAGTLRALITDNPNSKPVTDGIIKPKKEASFGEGWWFNA